MVTETELKEEQDKLVHLQTYYFLGGNFFGDDGFHNMSIYQPRVNILQLKEDNGTEFIIGGKYF